MTQSAHDHPAAWGLFLLAFAFFALCAFAPVIRGRK